MRVRRGQVLWEAQKTKFHEGVPLQAVAEARSSEFRAIMNDRKSKCTLVINSPAYQAKLKTFELKI